jgi:hypothetical protein
MMTFIDALLGSIALFLGGAWWGRERVFSQLALAAGVVLLALALGGCGALYHACREGLCR